MYKNMNQCGMYKSNYNGDFTNQTYPNLTPVVSFLTYIRAAFDFFGLV